MALLVQVILEVTGGVKRVRVLQLRRGKEID